MLMLCQHFNQRRKEKTRENFCKSALSVSYKYIFLGVGPQINVSCQSGALTLWFVLGGCWVAVCSFCPQVC